jgi:hypothetical protein
MLSEYEVFRETYSQSQERICLFYAYMGIKDKDKFWREASLLKKIKVVFIMLIFNFILCYKFLRNQPIVKK